MWVVGMEGGRHGQQRDGDTERVRERENERRVGGTSNYNLASDVSCMYRGC